jgi:hypothetical protein
MCRILRVPDVHRVEEHRAVGMRQVARVLEESIQSGEVLHHANTMAKHDHRVVRVAAVRHDVADDDVLHTTLAHDLHRFRCKIQRRDVRAAILERQRVQAASGSDVEHVTGACVEREVLDMAERVRFPEEERNRHLVFVPVVAANQQLGSVIPVVVGLHGEGVGPHGSRVHRTS